MSGEDYLIWHEKMERRQWESDQQMYSLLRQMKWLKQENKELWA